MTRSNQQSRFVRRRIPYRVCRCTPDGVVTHLEARLLKDIVNSAIHPIRCAASCKQKFMKAMRIGDLCAETGHFYWALKVWRYTADLIELQDYDDWRYVWFDNKRVSFHEVISETECELLDRRCSDLWRALGFPEYAWWDERFEYLAKRYYGTRYYYLFDDKYSSYYDEYIAEWEEKMMEQKAEQETAQLFQEGQCDNLPPCSQDFYDYWYGDHKEDFSWLTYKKEWL